MRWLENGLLIVGLTAFGVTAGGLGLTILALLTIFRDRPGEQPSLNWGSFYGAIGALLCGGLLGAFIGFSAALAIINQRDDRPWKLTTWLGIAAGLAGGLAICLSGLPTNSDALRGLLQFPPTAAVFIVATSTCGGVLGSLMPRKQRHDTSGRKRTHGR